MAFEALRQNLASSNRVVFLKHVGQIRALENETLRVALVIDLAQDVSASLWAEPEKGARFRQILLTASLSTKGLEEVAANISTASSGVRNAAAAILPPEHLPLLFGKSKAVTVFSSEPSDEVLQTLRVRPKIEAPFSSVAILATDDQTGNRRMLESRLFGVGKFSGLDVFRQAITSDDDFVAVILDGSFLRLLPSAIEQAKLVKELAEFSNFVWIRLHRDGLLLNETEVDNICRSARCQRGATTIEQLSIQSDPLLNESELSHILVARQFLAAAVDARFLPGELQPGETNILMAAVGRYARDQVFGEEFKLTSLTTRFMPEGRTPARIAMVTINESGIPIIAKVHDKVFVLDELRRFNKFIRPSDSRLRPEVSFHGNTGVILFGLIEDISDPLTPAPTFDACLRSAWIYEIYKYGKAPQDLLGPIESAVSKLERLNREKAVTSDFISLAAPINPALRNAENSGHKFHEDISLQSIRKTAEEIFEKMRVRAIVHGDMHLRNILVRGPGEAHLIDYAQSGPGHPAIDLVRLECALFTTVFRAFGQENLLIELQNNLNTPEKNFESLPDSFHDILHWKINHVAIRGAFMCRDAALRVLQLHGGGLVDYLAVKCLVGWTGLILLDQQVSSCRAIISAIRL
jgi:hypothetical protein